MAKTGRVAEALSGSTTVTLQVHPSDAACLAVTFDEVKKDLLGLFFQAEK